MVINTTSSTALPRDQTPFSVYFGQKPHWFLYDPIESDESDNDTDDDNDDDVDNHPPTDTEDYILTEIETRIAENNLKIHARIAGKG